MASNIVQNSGIQTQLLTTGDPNKTGTIDGSWKFNSAITLPDGSKLSSANAVVSSGSSSGSSSSGSSMGKSIAMSIVFS